MDWIAREVNSLAIDFELADERHENLENTSKSNSRRYRESFVRRCLRLYSMARKHTIDLAPTDTSPEDEACVLAAKTLIKMSQDHGERSHLLQAASLLSMLLEDSKHNFNARLLLISLLYNLGLPTLALQHYSHLGVKEILFESCSPMIFTRLSSLLPFTGSKQDSMEMMRKGLKFYANALQQIPRHQLTSLKHENYTQCVKLDTFSHTMQVSLTRQLLMWERRRIALMRATPCDEENLALRECPPTPSQDDSKHLEQERTIFLRGKSLLQQPPPLSSAYVKMLECFYRLEESPSTLIAKLSEDIDSLQSSLSSGDCELTSTEVSMLGMAKRITHMHVLLDNKQYDELESVVADPKALFLKIHGPMESSYASGVVPDWKYLHRLSSSLEMLRIVKHSADRLTQHLKSAKIPSLQAALKDLPRRIQKELTTLKTNATATLTGLKRGSQDDYLFRVTFESYGTMDEDASAAQKKPSNGENPGSIGEHGDVEYHETQAKIRNTVLQSFGEQRAKVTLKSFANAGVEALELLIANLKI